MAAYYLFFLSIVIFYHIGKQYKYKLIFLIIFIFSAIRFDVGYDYATYYNILISSENLDYFRFGVIDRFLIDISRYMGLYQLYFIFTSFIITYCVHVTVKKYSVNYLYSMLFFISIPLFYFNSFSIIRQFVAVAIVLYSFKFIIDRKIFFFLLTVFVASLFHFTAIITLVLYFLYKITLGRIFSLLLIISSIFLTPFLINFIQTNFPYYALYLNENSSYGKSFYYFLLMIYFFIFMNYRRLSNESKVYFGAFVIGVCIYGVGLNLGEVVPRLSLYFIIFIILLLPDIFMKFKFKQGYFLVVFTSLLLLTITLYLASNNQIKNPYIPYQVFIGKNYYDIRVER